MHQDLTPSIVIEQRAFQEMPARRYPWPLEINTVDHESSMPWLELDAWWYKVGLGR